MIYDHGLAGRIHQFFLFYRSYQRVILNQQTSTEPGVAKLSPVQSHTFVKIDDEIISTAILLLPLIKKGCCQLQAKVIARSTG